MADIGAEGITGSDNIAKVSIVGVGMRNHAGIASTMFKVLSDEGINILMISTSEIKVSCVIEEKYTELAVRALHDAFGLEKGGAKKRPAKSAVPVKAKAAPKAKPATKPKAKSKK
ncbi:MAG: ACT domain-containing protein [Desulfurivibrionaceae bacterium]|nr:ACT domain-containing protein [Desulfurivibrionaceae bacterium]